MIPVELYSFFAALLLGAAHIVGLNLAYLKEKYEGTWRLSSKLNDILSSLTAGISVTYIFRIFLPEVLQRPEYELLELSTMALMGFVVFHLALKYAVKQSSKDNNAGGKENNRAGDLVHTIFSWLYGQTASLAVIARISTDFFSGAVLLVIIVVHLVLTEVQFSDYFELKQNRFLKTMFFASGPLLAWTVIGLGVLSSEAIAVISAFALGAVIYVSVREEIPFQTSGNPYAFVCGLVITLLATVLL